MITDPHGIILQADQNVATLFCVDVPGLMGRSLLSFLAAEQEDAFERLCQRALARHEAVDEMLALRCPGQQETRPVSVSVVAVTQSGQAVALSWILGDAASHVWVGVSKIAFDLAEANQHLQIELAERQKAEAAAAKRERELSALHKATTALLSTLDLQALLGQILDAATSAIAVAEKGMVHLIAPDTGQLEMRAAIGYNDPRIQKINFPESGGYVARAVQGRRPLLIRDVRREPSGRDGKCLDAHLIPSVIVAPLIHPTGQVLGALSLEALEATAFDEDDLRLLVSFAATATTAIYNAQLHAEVQKLAITDALTGLYNRRGFEELGKRELERLRRFGHPLSAMMVDVDFFKKVNDAYGHKVGDQVIRSVAKRLTGSLREVDIIGRFGGDEFTVLLPETDMFTAASVADRTLTSVSELPIVVEQLALNLTVSIGVVKATMETPSLDVLLEQADQAMYAAKQAGRNQVQIR
ncbi:MAG: sensor domain-containing diguanylate cyclase [Chloroflexota bacterium]